MTGGGEAWGWAGKGGTVAGRTVGLPPVTATAACLEFDPGGGGVFFLGRMAFPISRFARQRCQIGPTIGELAERVLRAAG